MLSKIPKTTKKIQALSASLNELTTRPKISKALQERINNSILTENDSLLTFPKRIRIRKFNSSIKDDAYPSKEPKTLMDDDNDSPLMLPKIYDNKRFVDQLRQTYLVRLSRTNKLLEILSFINSWVFLNYQLLENEFLPKFDLYFGRGLTSKQQSSLQVSNSNIRFHANEIYRMLRVTSDNFFKLNPFKSHGTK